MVEVSEAQTDFFQMLGIHRLHPAIEQWQHEYEKELERNHRDDDERRNDPQ